MNGDSNEAEISPKYLRIDKKNLDKLTEQKICYKVENGFYSEIVKKLKSMLVPETIFLKL